MSLDPDKQATYERVKRRLEDADRSHLEKLGSGHRYFGHDLQSALTRAERREFRQLIHDAVLENGCKSATGALVILIEELLATEKVQLKHVRAALMSESVARAARLNWRLVDAGAPIVNAEDS